MLEKCKRESRIVRIEKKVNLILEAVERLRADMCLIADGEAPDGYERVSLEPLNKTDT